MIEPLVSSQWFVRTDGMGAKALAAVEEKEIRILPERSVCPCVVEFASRAGGDASFHPSVVLGALLLLQYPELWWPSRGSCETNFPTWREMLPVLEGTVHAHAVRVTTVVPEKMRPDALGWRAFF